MSENSTSDWSWIDAAAERFERAWKQGPRPRIEDFLIKVPETQWPPLLQELMRVESELRRKVGEQPAAQEYRERFPAHEAVITAVFQPAMAVTTATDEAEPAGSTRATSAPPRLAGSLPAELANHPDYEIIRELGLGGMGVVYLAHNRIMDRDEVLKVIGQHIVEQPGVLDRFLREIRAVGKLRHPNIVSAYTAFRCGGGLVFAMEYVDGLDLRRMVKAKGPMPVVHACYFAHQAALGLQHAHEEGLVHRDIKPANLMLSRRKNRAVIKVLDFGLSKAVSEQNARELGISMPTLPINFGEHLTCTGEMLGTPDFIAPEQIVDSQRADIRADIYSLGCTLYFLLSGRPPFQATSIRDTLQAHQSLDAPLLSSVRPEVPAELSEVVAKMLRKEPDHRFQTPSEVAGVLAPFFRRPSVAAGSPNIGRDQDLAPDSRHVTPDPAAETRGGTWSSLIDFTEDERDAAAVTDALKPARTQSRWLWPAAAGGVLACGLITMWAAGAFKVKTAKNERVEPAGVQVSDGTGESKSLRQRRDPVVASRSTKTVTTADGPFPGSHATTPPSDATTTDPVSREVASQATAPVTGSSPVSIATTRPSESRVPGWAFRQMATIRTPDRVIQSRLLPDGEHVVYETLGQDRALWLGDLTQSNNPRKLEGNPVGWVQLALSSDGRFAVLAGNDKTLWNWDLKTGQSHRLRTARADITAIALSADNQLVAFVSGGAIHLSDAARDSSGKKKAITASMGNSTDLIAFTPDGRRIVSTHADRAIRVWDVKARRAIRQSETPKAVTALAVFPVGPRALISFSGQTFEWNLATSRQLRRAPGFGASLAVSADGRRALIGGGNLMQLWDLETDEQLMRHEHGRTVLHVAFSSDDRRGVSSTEEGVHVWALPPVQGGGEQKPVVGIAQFPSQPGVHYSVVVSPNGKWVLTSGWPGTIHLWDRETTKLINSFNKGGKPISSLAFSPDSTLALSGGDDGVVGLWDLASGQHREFHGHLDNVMSVAFSPDGTRGYSAGGGVWRDGWQDSKDFAIRVWDLETSQQLPPFEGHNGMVCSMAVSPNGRSLISGGSDATLIVWDARTGRPIHRLRGHTARVECVAFLPDGRRAVSSALDGTIRLWDLEGGREVLLHFKDPTGQNGRLAISPGGERLLSADGGARVLRYWNFDTGKLIQKLEWDEAPASGSFTPDGRHVVWGGWGGVLRMYRLTDIPERPIAPPRRSPKTRRRSGSPDVS
jgi:WD40 repeat protein/serine/threonine protein kinase